jgi:glucose-1-phosphate adenylyltransferase
MYRMVDFVLSNLVNGGYRKLVVLTQYKSHSLDRHITKTWRLSTLLDNYVTPVPAQQRLGPAGSPGSATRSTRAATSSTTSGPSHVVVFGADHIYRMDPSQMVAEHVASGRR